MNTLDQLKQFTDIVADTGDIQEIIKFAPSDATTNPSLLYKAAQLPQYSEALESAIHEAGDLQLSTNIARVCELFSLHIAKEILQAIPGYLSLEVDARLSFNKAQTIATAKQLLKRLEEHGVDTSRILIKIAATWEGIQAARELESQGIKCNVTLLFSYAQAVACAEADVFLISPFVGRILDWHKKNNGIEHYSGEEDPGVLSVRKIYRYFKEHEYKTIVMGASFRNTEEIIALAGCDKLTISPALLDELKKNTSQLTPALLDTTNKSNAPSSMMTEAQFRWSLNQDAMATEKLAEGIRNFSADQVRLEKLILSKSEQSALASM